VVIAAIVILGVMAFGLTIAKTVAYTAAETHLLAAVAAERIPQLVNLSLALDRIFGPSIAAPIGLAAAVLVFVVSRRWTSVLHFVLLVAGTWLGSEVVKLVVHRPRPTARLADTLVLLALVTAGTRVYLGVHYPTDALASLIYSAAAFVAVETLWRRFSPRVFPGRRRAHLA
jgi:undecaprenyl-diphosphatase